MLKIENNVPVPERGGARSKYPFGEMEIGDSFTIPRTDKGFRVDKFGRRIHPVSSAASWYGKRNGKVFTIRLMKDGAISVWRVE